MVASQRYSDALMCITIPCPGCIDPTRATQPYWKSSEDLSRKLTARWVGQLRSFASLRMTPFWVPRTCGSQQLVATAAC